MDYYILDKTNIVEYLHGIKNVKNYFGDAALEIDEIGDGNLNFVFIVKSKEDNTKALIVKQAVPYLRCVGVEFPLNRDQMTYEIRALKSYSLQSPEHTPKIYDANEEMSAIVIEFLAEHIIMRKGLIAQVIYPKFADHISTFLANNLFKTSSLCLDSTSKRKLINQFNNNTELCKLTEDFVFTFAFMEHDSNDDYANNHESAQKLFSDMKFKKAVLELKYKFMNQTDTLLHGDLHTGSIMLNKKETYIIDPEFAFIGPFGFDVGALIGNLIMSYTSHMALKTEITYCEWLLDLIAEILLKFENKFLALWNEEKESALLHPGFLNEEEEVDLYKKEFMLNILRDSVGYAGCKMTRRMFGIAGVEDIREIIDLDVRNKAIKHTLKISKKFVKHYKEIEKIEEEKVRKRCRDQKVQAVKHALRYCISCVCLVRREEDKEEA